ncbi:SRPBCC family protein [Gordonia sp. SID5947]|uniref:SRPBCC family protein n=1 Tax=Gordonia sp. SID5947 TaxID=2690315 RepID=UPI00136C44FE|nr:SRPBCC family protein [Gordonia sp. SID5947]MYR05382.1 SRPBCC family protein [Gordonia sp. SID5947]
MPEMRSRHLSVVMPVSASEVYAFAADPENLPHWAAGLASGVRRNGDELVVASPMGEVVVRFAPPNQYGILDHEVTLPDGTVVANPLRIIDHPDGSEAVFTIRQRDLTDAQFENDCAAVERDLAALRAAVTDRV